MRCIITFIHDNRKIYINTEAIKAVVQHPNSSTKTSIVLSNDLTYTIDIPATQVVDKIRDAMDMSLFTKKAVLKSL